jgi:hypothetical protein
MLTHAAHYQQPDEPLCQDCYEILKGFSEPSGKNS